MLWTSTVLSGCLAMTLTSLTATPPLALLSTKQHAEERLDLDKKSMMCFPTSRKVLPFKCVLDLKAIFLVDKVVD